MQKNQLTIYSFNNKTWVSLTPTQEEKLKEVAKAILRQEDRGRGQNKRRHGVWKIGNFYTELL